MCSTPRGKNTRRVATVNSPARGPEGGVRNSGSLAAFPATTARPNSKGGGTAREAREPPAPFAKSPLAAGGAHSPWRPRRTSRGTLSLRTGCAQRCVLYTPAFPLSGPPAKSILREAREFLQTRSVSGGDPFPTVLRGFLNSLIARIEVFPRKSSLTGLLSRVLRATTL
jgi:hypothetical protein